MSDVAQEIDNEELETTLSELEGSLAGCRTTLEAFEKKERFVGVRIGRYRTLMEKREVHICDLMKRIQQSQLTIANKEEGYDDLENKSLDSLRDELASLQSKHTADQAALRSVEDLHKDILVQIEIFRRRIVDLEEKQQDILSKRDECRDFLIAASDCT